MAAISIEEKFVVIKDPNCSMVIARDRFFGFMQTFFEFEILFVRSQTESIPAIKIHSIVISPAKGGVGKNLFDIHGEAAPRVFPFLLFGRGAPIFSFRERYLAFEGEKLTQFFHGRGQFQFGIRPAESTFTDDFQGGG